jgi:hypothetical protein
MFSFDTSDTQRFVVSLIGALILSTACVFSAVGPAKAASAISAVQASDAPVAQSARACPRLMAIRL